MRLNSYPAITLPNEKSSGKTLEKSHALLPPFLSLCLGDERASAANEEAAQNPRLPWFAWQEEYGVVSVTESHLPVVVRYVQNQQEHHAQNTLRARLEHMAGENT